MLVGQTRRVVSTADIINFVDLTNEQLERYSRQMILSGFGGIGQEKLLKSSVLIVGVGGLGSLVLAYLAGCGIGKIGIVDFDKITLSNLHRQTIYNVHDLGKLKVISAQEKANDINPEVTIVTFEERLDKNNIDRIFGDFEIIVDGLDNFSDKFLVNDKAVLLRKKLIHAGAVGYEGQILTVIPGKSSCLRCYFPDGEPTGYRQTCSEVGILGTCVGTLSVLQANEVIKLILGIGKLYTDRVLKFNALDGSFYEFKTQGINKDCSVCRKIILNC